MGWQHDSREKLPNAHYGQRAFDKLTRPRSILVCYYFNSCLRTYYMGYSHIS
jgi:hypothetical protein